MLVEEYCGWVFLDGIEGIVIICIFVVLVVNILVLSIYLKLVLF